MLKASHIPSFCDEGRGQVSTQNSSTLLGFADIDAEKWRKPDNMSIPIDASDASKAVQSTPAPPHELKPQAVADRKRPELAARTRKISPRQEVAISNLLRFPTIVRAARASRISERTLRRWMQRPSFAANFQSAKRAILDRTLDTLLRGSEQCANQLMKLATNPKVSEAARVRASTKVIEFVVEQVQLRAVEHRLAEIEAALRRQPTRRTL